LCFLQRAPELPDPTSILRGSGEVVRNVALVSARDLDNDDVVALVEAALEQAVVPMDASRGPELTSSRCQPHSDRADDQAAQVVYVLRDD
jgi:hypothetical protein